MATSPPPPDYYQTLNIPPTATAPQIRDAYKRCALKSHPDRVPADSAERPARTRQFQAINDAYYTLSDPTRRRDYDDARRFHHYSSGAAGSEEEPNASAPPPRPDASTGFPWSAFGFGTTPPTASPNSQQFANDQFGSAFEEMLRDEGLATDGPDARPTRRFWSLVGTLSGGTLGFIVANVPGAIAGAVAGNRLGAVRDASGKSVYAVFQELPQADKARVLAELAGKVFATAVSG
jgi:curved DNA-binding protein CbpA